MWNMRTLNFLQNFVAVHHWASLQYRLYSRVYRYRYFNYSNSTVLSDVRYTAVQYSTLPARTLDIRADMKRAKVWYPPSGALKLDGTRLPSGCKRITLTAGLKCISLSAVKTCQKGNQDLESANFHRITRSRYDCCRLEHVFGLFTNLEVSPVLVQTSQSPLQLTDRPIHREPSPTLA